MFPSLLFVFKPSEDRNLDVCLLRDILCVSATILCSRFLSPAAVLLLLSFFFPLTHDLFC